MVPSLTWPPTPKRTRVSEARRLLLRRPTHGTTSFPSEKKTLVETLPMPSPRPFLCPKAKKNVLRRSGQAEEGFFSEGSETLLAPFRWNAQRTRLVAIRGGSRGTTDAIPEKPSETRAYVRRARALVPSMYYDTGVNPARTPEVSTEQVTDEKRRVPGNQLARGGVSIFLLTRVARTVLAVTVDASGQDFEGEKI